VRFPGRYAHWEHSRGLVFARFAGVFGCSAFLVLGGMGAVAFLLTRHLGGRGPAAIVVWVAGIGLALTLPALAVRLAMVGFRGIATPVADLMSAADAVAEGDLSVRVEEPVGSADFFGRLARSFNRMVSELERADQRRRNLTADVAHELRTPLHIIQGNLEGILDDVYAPTEEHISATLEETRALARLVDDLQTLSLAEAGELPLRWETVDVGELLGDVCTSFSGEAEVAGIDLVVEVEDALALTIVGDAGRLDQVLGHLVSNALRYVPAGGRITLHAEAAKEGLRIVVSDTGEGIPPEDLPYVFDRFWKGDRSRTRASGAGSGLGLAIARQLVQAHGGGIGVESTVGCGTTFTIKLPRAAPRAQASPSGTRSRA
jgi:two-component system sensor histidine kinase BaeS